MDTSCSFLPGMGTHDVAWRNKFPFAAPWLLKIESAAFKICAVRQVCWVDCLRLCLHAVMCTMRRGQTSRCRCCRLTGFACSMCWQTPCQNWMGGEYIRSWAKEMRNLKRNGVWRHATTCTMQGHMRRA